MSKNSGFSCGPAFLTVGALSRRSGVPVSAIHFYERKGLIASERNAANHRVFPRATLRVLAVIRVGQQAGIRLEEIREKLALVSGGRPLGMKDWAKISEAWERELSERIAALERLKNRLTGCVACGCLSMRDCRVINPGDRAAAEGPGAMGLDGRM
jgi:redox-sensitive transcriptional activator SoxR